MPSQPSCCRQSRKPLPRCGEDSPVYLELLYRKGNQLLQQPGPGQACPPLVRCGGRADTWMAGEEGKQERREAWDSTGREVEFSLKMAIRWGTSPWQHFYSRNKQREERPLKETTLQKPCANSIKKHVDFPGKAISCVFPMTPSRSESFYETRQSWDIEKLRRCCPRQGCALSRG